MSVGFTTDTSGERLPERHRTERQLCWPRGRIDNDEGQGIEDRKTDTRTMMISSAALTALDLLRYPRASGGIHNVATILSDLAQKIEPEQLAAISVTVKRSIVQRLGHLLDRLGHGAYQGRCCRRCGCEDRCPGLSSIGRKHGTWTSRPSRGITIPAGASSCGARRSLTNDPGAEHHRLGQCRSLG